MHIVHGPSRNKDESKFDYQIKLLMFGAQTYTELMDSVYDVLHFLFEDGCQPYYYHYLVSAVCTNSNAIYAIHFYIYVNNCIYVLLRSNVSIHLKRTCILWQSSVPMISTALIFDGLSWKTFMKVGSLMNLLWVLWTSLVAQKHTYRKSNIWLNVPWPFSPH